MPFTDLLKRVGRYWDHGEICWVGKLEFSCGSYFVLLRFAKTAKTNNVFHQLRQAKFVYDCLILSLSQFL